MKIRYRAADYDSIRAFTSNICTVSKQKKLSSLSNLETSALSISRLDLTTPVKSERLKFSIGAIKVNEDKLKSHDKIKKISLKTREYIRSS